MEDKFTTIRNAERLVIARQYDRAISEYQKLLEFHGEDPSILNTLGDLLLRSQRREEALACFHRVAEIFSQSGFSGKAIAIYRKIDQMWPDDPDTLGRLAELYRKRSLHSEALRHQRRLLDVQIQRGERESALQTLREVIDQAPTDFRLHRDWANLLAVSDPEEAARHYVDAARLALNQDLAEEARVCLASATGLDPANAEALRMADELGVVASLSPEAEAAASGLESETEIEDLLAQQPGESGLVIEKSAETPAWDVLETGAAAGEIVDLAAGEASGGAEGRSPGKEAETAESWQDFGLIEPAEASLPEGALPEGPPEAEVPVEAKLGEEALLEAALVAAEAPTLAAGETRPEGPASPEATPAEEPVAEELPGEKAVENPEVEAAVASPEVAADRLEAAEAIPEPEPESLPYEAAAGLTEGTPAEAGAGRSGEEVAEALAEVDFCLKLDLKADAERLVLRLLAEHPEDPRIQERARRMGLVESGPENVAYGSEVDSVLEELFFEDSLDTSGNHAAATSPAGVSPAETAQSQYDLGVAYREMGMLDDAIDRFQRAYQLYSDESEPSQAMLCCSMLSSTLIQCGDFRRAVEWADIGLSLPRSRSGEWRQLEYDRAQALEHLGENEESLAAYRRILQDDPDFRDVRERVAALDPLSS